MALNPQENQTERKLPGSFSDILRSIPLFNQIASLLLQSQLEDTVSRPLELQWASGRQLSWDSTESEALATGVATKTQHHQNIEDVLKLTASTVSLDFSN